MAEGGTFSHVMYRKMNVEVNVRKIREGLGMSRHEFANTFGFSVRTLQNWEEGRRGPYQALRDLI